VERVDASVIVTHWGTGLWERHQMGAYDSASIIEI